MLVAPLHWSLIPSYAIIIVSLGIAIGLVLFAPGRPAYRAIAAFMVFNATLASMDIVILSTESLAVLVAADKLVHLADAGALTSLMALAMWFPSAHRHRWTVTAATAIVALTSAAVIWIGYDSYRTFGPPGGGEPALVSLPAADLLHVGAIHHVYTAALLAWPLIPLIIAMRRQSESQAARSMLVLVVALSIGRIFGSLDTAVWAASHYSEISSVVGGSPWLSEIIVPLLATGLATTALIITMRQDGGWKHPARWGLLALAVVVAAGTGSFLPGAAPLLVLIGTIFGLVFPLAIAYAALRGEFPGLDLKARRGVRSGTLAAVFLAAGFIASETAAEFLGASTGNQYWGIGAAGLLVFAIAPLHRAADRIAHRAVPAATTSFQDGRHLAWEEMIRLAWADGQITRQERLHLEAARERLGVPAELAGQIERRVLGTAADP